MKTAIYIRVSTEEQVKEGYSVSAQMQKLKAFCISQDWEIEGIYADEGISAKDTNRPQLQEMLKNIKEEKIECVLVYRLDRLTRSVFDLYKMLELFDKHDCKFKSATEVYDTTTAMGRMFITIVAALAQWERENLGERLSFGYAEKARQGKYSHNVNPLGYNRNPNTQKLEIVRNEAETVKKIFELYKSMGMNQVAKHLNDNKMFTKSGNVWSDNTIMKVLRNHIYYGATKWKEMIVENTHEPIITEEAWNNTQMLIEKRRSAPPRTVSSRYIFSGKMKCNNCGNNLVGHYVSYKNTKGEKVIYPQYRCRRRNDGRCTGKSIYISEGKMEKAFLEHLSDFDYKRYLEDHSETISEKGKDKLNKKEETTNTDDLEKELNKIENRKKKFQYAWTEDIISFEDFKKRMEEVKREEEAITEQLDSINHVVEEVHVIDKQMIIDALKSIQENWSLLDAKEKKNLVQSIVDEIHYELVDNELTIKHIDYL